MVVTNTATALSQETTANASGYLSDRKPADRSVSGDRRSTRFRRVTIDSKTPLEINQTLRVDVQLQVGKVANAVSVESRPSQVETENSTIAETVTGQAIYELPLNGRNTLDLIGRNRASTPTNPDSGAAGNYSIGGQRTDSVTYLLDGGMNNNLLDNTVVANPNPDAVAEFRLLESNYSAEYGRNAGGIVSVVTKSGTNQFHGTAYDYVRNNFFDANTFFNNEQGLPVPVLKRNQFGGTVGGPSSCQGRDKIFFFFSYEGQRQTALDASPGKVNTFTPAEANGDFSHAVNGGPDPNVVCFLTGLTLSGGPCTTPQGTPGVAHPYFQPNPALAAQGIISPASIDPVAKAYFGHGLLPISPTGFLFPEAAATDNYNEYLGRFDYNLTPRDVISGTFTTQDRPLLSPFDGSGTYAGFPYHE